MARLQRRRRVRAFAITLLACLPGVLLAVASPQQVAAAAGTLAATPNANVTDGQYVRLDLTGFAPSVGVAFRQCIANPVNVATDCTARNPQVTASIDATGSGETYLPVYSGNDTLLRNSGGTGSIRCDDKHPCVIAAVASLNDLTNAVFASISLAPSTDACPDPGASAVFGTGSATAYRAIYAWQSQVCVAPTSLPIVYAVSNSVDGVGNFAQGQSQANFGVTGPLPPITLPATAPSYKVAPITGSGLVLAYKMYDLRGPQITTLTLTPYEIAQIYLGQLANFAADPGVKSLNPGIQFPGVMRPYARAEHSAETWVFTSWLAQTLGPGSWPAGPETVFPAVAGVTDVSGSRALGSIVASPGTDWFTYGNMGFMDSSTASYYGLTTVRIRMPNGSIVAATPTSIAQGLSLATQNTDGTYTPNYTPSDPTAWPMAMASSMLVPTNQISGAQGKVLAAFLKYAVQQGQTALPAGYVPLPAIMVNQSMAAADLIPQADTVASGDGTPGGAGSAGGNAAFDAGGDTSAAGLGTDNGLSASGSPPAAATAAPAGGSGRGGATVAGGPALASLPVAGGVQWALIAIGAVALFGVVVGPLTYLFAPPWPPPALRRLGRLRRLIRLRPARALAP